MAVVMALRLLAGEEVLLCGLKVGQEGVHWKGCQWAMSAV